MNFEGNPHRPLAIRGDDGRYSVLVGGAYQTMELGPAMAMHQALGDVLASSDSRVLTCVYCGHQYPQNTPAAGDSVLTDHIRVCEKHPLRKAEGRIGRLRSILERFIGVSSPEQLRKMADAIRMLVGDEADRALALEAIRELLDLDQSGDEGENALNAKRLEFLAKMENNHLYLTRNAEHASNYQTASQWIDDEFGDFDDVPADELQRMRDTNTIWCLQVYPDTPIGFWQIYGASAESVIDRAMATLSTGEGDQ